MTDSTALNLYLTPIVSYLSADEEESLPSSNHNTVKRKNSLEDCMLQPIDTIIIESAASLMKSPNTPTSFMKVDTSSSTLLIPELNDSPRSRLDALPSLRLVPRLSHDYDDHRDDTDYDFPLYDKFSYNGSHWTDMPYFSDDEEEEEEEDATPSSIDSTYKRSLPTPSIWKLEPKRIKLFTPMDLSLTSSFTLLRKEDEWRRPPRHAFGPSPLSTNTSLYR
jgi:hypothetical protein